MIRNFVGIQHILTTSIRLFFALYLIFASTYGFAQNRAEISYSAFTQDLLKSFVQHAYGSEYVVVESWTDEGYNYLSVYEATLDAVARAVKRSGYLGEQDCFGVKTVAVGKYRKDFFAGRKVLDGDISHLSSDEIWNNDGLDWTICFNSDMTVNLSLSGTSEMWSDLDPILAVTKKYYGKAAPTAEDLSRMYIAPSDRPASLPDGIPSLEEQFLDNFDWTVFQWQLKYTIITIDFLVDADGVATFDGTNISKDDKPLYDEVMRIKDILCKNKFVPAVHRGYKVKTRTGIAIDYRIIMEHNAHPPKNR